MTKAGLVRALHTQHGNMTRSDAGRLIECVIETMKKHLETFTKETDFRGLNQLLARGLYSEAMVFLRELIQNAGDSITLLQELLPDHVGKVEIFTVAIGYRF